MEIKLAFDIIRVAVESYGDPVGIEALKLVEEKLTTTNKPSMPVCPKCGSMVQVSDLGYDCTNMACVYGGAGKPTHIG